MLPGLPLALGIALLWDCTSLLAWIKVGSVTPGARSHTLCVLQRAPIKLRVCLAMHTPCSSAGHTRLQRHLQGCRGSQQQAVDRPPQP